MLGDATGNAPGGFLLLDENFEVAGRWEPTERNAFNYDFWYQPRHNVMVSSEWARRTPSRPASSSTTSRPGNYGRTLHFWDWTDRRLIAERSIWATRA